MTAGSGMTYGEPFASFDPATSSWRTPQASFDGSDEFSGAWPKSGAMTSDGMCSARPTWGRRTVGRASSSLLPIPDGGVFNDGQSVEAWKERKTRELAKGYNGNGGGTPLAMAVRLLPTPTSSDGRGATHPESCKKWVSRGTNLPEAVQLLPTPRPQTHDGGSRPDRTWHLRKGAGGPNLVTAIATAAQLLPTPTSRDYKGRNQRDDRTCLPGLLTSLPSDSGKASSDPPPILSTTEDASPRSS